MKKIYLLVILFGIIISLNIGCPESETTTTTVSVSFVKIDLSDMKKKEYAQNETLDLTGLYLDVTYSDNSVQKVYYIDEPSNFTIADISALATGTQNAKCKYKGKEFDVPVIIYEARTTKNSWEEKNIPNDYQLNHEFWDNANVYFVLTDRFYNGNENNDTSYGREKGIQSNGNTDCAKFFGGDIAGLTTKLNYIKDLGITAIWITAPYEQIHGWCQGAGNAFKHYPYHGYYALDYTNMDANVGTIDEFRTFVNSAHQLGIRIIMDVVMNHPGYGSLEDIKNLFPSVLKATDFENLTLANYHDHFIDYSKEQHGWDDWWGGDWVRAGLCSHYTTGSGEIDGSQSGLPDFKTGTPKNVTIPTFLTKKYTNDLSEYYPYDGHSLSTPTTQENYRVRDYLIKWLSDWVHKFGIDGFRCDTAKHVEKEAWYQLKVACIDALRDWKSNNPTMKVDDSDFWMVGEVFSHGVEKDMYFDDGGFNSLINFKFRKSSTYALTNPSKIDDIYTSYADKINRDNSFNVLSYISSHDTGAQDKKGLYYNAYAETDPNKQKMAGSLLAFCPGAIQIYYGDECGRKDSDISVSDKDQKTRSQMPWNEDGYNNLGYQFDSDIHAHWSKVLNFRKKHVAVGAGTHTKIKDAPYTFSRVKGDDKVVVVLGASGSVEVDVSSIGASSVKDYYTGTTVAVTNGKATFTADSNGVILIEAAE